ncbi:TPA: hypothetical protein ACGWER_001741 [Streptococcus agalactiae]|nr:hypothetical protein [Streptococcus agalactiae]HEO2267389.1 hypothetical protein [Streptococcus agalactiae]HEO7770315.1 hypothetical protein [Streptococcus agalactiae]
MGLDYSKIFSKTPVNTEVRVETDLSVIQKTRELTREELLQKQRENNELPKGLTFVNKITSKGISQNAKKENRKLKLKSAIESGRIKSVDEGANYIGVTHNTALRYLREMNISIKGNMIG